MGVRILGFLFIESWGVNYILLLVLLFYFNLLNLNLIIMVFYFYICMFEYIFYNNKI